MIFLEQDESVELKHTSGTCAHQFKSTNCDKVEARVHNVKMFCVKLACKRIFKCKQTLANNIKSYEPIRLERGKRYVFTLSTDWIYGVIISRIGGWTNETSKQTRITYYKADNRWPKATAGNMQPKSVVSKNYKGLMILKDGKKQDQNIVQKSFSQGKLNLYKYLLGKGKVVHLTISAVNTNFVLLHHYLIFT